MVLGRRHIPFSNGEPTLYDEAVQALMSPLHQAMDKESLQKSAERRVHTVSDMRHYWNRIQFGNHHATNNHDCTEGRTLPVPPRMIHITGTKGKGSTACFCQAILNSHGYSTGLFTSPHLMDMRERIRLDGHPVHPNIFAKAYWKIRNDLESHTAWSEDLPTLPGYFRMLTLMAFYIFAELKVDVWIVEVGMGGRYDATNFLDRTAISHRSICGVTLLDLDHTRVLGETLVKIAWEKGGIFAVDKETTRGLSPKPSAVDSTEGGESGWEPPTHEEDSTTLDSNEQVTLDNVSSISFVLDSNNDDVLAVFHQCASNEGRGGCLKTVDARGEELRAALGNRTLGIAGEHQYGNANLAIHLCHATTAHETDGSLLPTLADYLQDPKTLQGLIEASWPARCQTVRRPGSCLEFQLDGAHTPLSLTATIEWFTKQSALTPRRILVFNCSHERNPIELLDLLKDVPFTCVYFVKPDSCRPSPVYKQTAQELLEEANIPVNEEWVQSIREHHTSGETETWQETLGILWKHLVVLSTTTSEMTLRHASHYAVPLICNKSSLEIVSELGTTISEPTDVLVTGSLYIVGSFLTALDWVEQSSTDKSALLLG